jgi:hypothetical protein
VRQSPSAAVVPDSRTERLAAAIATRTVIPVPMKEIIRNFTYVSNYLVVADRYWVHRAAEFMLKTLGIGALNWTRAPRLEGKLLSIEAGAHSGSTFLRSNIHPELRDKVVSHIHLQWSLRRCVRYGVPTVLLIRNPIEACVSKHFRSAARNARDLDCILSLRMASSRQSSHRHVPRASQ